MSSLPCQCKTTIQGFYQVVRPISLADIKVSKPHQRAIEVIYLEEHNIPGGVVTHTINTGDYRVVICVGDDGIALYYIGRNLSKIALSPLNSSVFIHL